MRTNYFHDIWTVTKFTMRDMLGRKSFDDYYPSGNCTGF